MGCPRARSIASTNRRCAPFVPGASTHRRSANSSTARATFKAIVETANRNESTSPDVARTVARWSPLAQSLATVPEQRSEKELDRAALSGLDFNRDSHSRA